MAHLTPRLSPFISYLLPRKCEVYLFCIFLHLPQLTYDGLRLSLSLFFFFFFIFLMHFLDAFSFTCECILLIILNAQRLPSMAFPTRNILPAMSRFNLQRCSGPCSSHANLWLAHHQLQANFHYSRAGVIRLLCGRQNPNHIRAITMLRHQK